MISSTESALSKILNCETSLFHVGKELDANIEAYAKYIGGKESNIAITAKDSGILAKYAKDEKIQINSILDMMDTNIETMMAPNDLVDYETTLRHYKLSLEYINSLNKDSDFKSNEVIKLERDIEEIKQVISEKLKLIASEPMVNSIYLRIYDPSKLEVYKIRPVNLKNDRNQPQVI